MGDCASNVREALGTAEIGITLAREHQRRGFATEMTAALIEALVTEHELHRLVAETDERNAEVQRLLERLGFREVQGRVDRPARLCAARARLARSERLLAVVAVDPRRAVRPSLSRLDSRQACIS